MTFRWLHFSDLHAGSPYYSINGNYVLESLAADVSEQQWKPDIVFLTGDIAFGQYADGPTLAQQYDIALEAILKVLAPLADAESPRFTICMVPGNHDVDRSQIETHTQEFLDRERDQLEVDKVFRDVIRNRPDSTLTTSITRRFSAYMEFIRRLRSHGFNVLDAGVGGAVHHLRVGNLDLAIMLANTALKSSGRSDRGALWSGIGTLTNMSPSDLRRSHLRVLCTHHSADWLTERDGVDMRRELAARFSLHLHGHKHDAWFAGGGARCLELGAGALHDSLGSELVYSYGELQPRTGAGSVRFRKYYESGRAWGPLMIPGLLTQSGTADVHVKLFRRDKEASQRGFRWKLTLSNIKGSVLGIDMQLRTLASGEKFAIVSRDDNSVVLESGYALFEQVQDLIRHQVDMQVGRLRFLTAIPQVASTIPVYNNLPPPLTTFYFRREAYGAFGRFWDSPSRLLQVIGDGGVGKTSLVNRWLERVANEPGSCAAVFAWTFYGQGSPTGVTSGRTFLEVLAQFIGFNPGLESGKSDSEFGGALADYFVKQGGLLVLDGLEVLQQGAPSHFPGVVTDAAVSSFLEAALRPSPQSARSAIVVVSRLQMLPENTAEGIELLSLDRLTTDEALRFLEEYAASGLGESLTLNSEKGAPRQAAFKRISLEADTRPLLLSLLLRYVTLQLGGDLARLDLALVNDVAELVVRSLSEPDSLAIRCVATAVRPLSLTGLQDLLRLMSKESAPDLRDSVARVASMGLLYGLRFPDDKTAYYDMHPLLREKYRARLWAKSPELAMQLRAAYFEMFLTNLPGVVETAAHAEVVADAIRLAWEVGRGKEAIDDLYRKRLMRGNVLHAWRSLCATGSVLACVRTFFAGDNLAELKGADGMGNEVFTPLSRFEFLLDCAEFSADTRQYGAVVQKNLLAGAEQVLDGIHNADSVCRFWYLKWKAEFAARHLDIADHIASQIEGLVHGAQWRRAVASRCRASSAFLRARWSICEESGRIGLQVQHEAAMAGYVDMVEVRVTTSAYVSLAKLFLGNIEECLRVCDAMVRVARTSPNRHNLVLALCFAGWCSEMLELDDAAIALATEAEALSQKHGYGFQLLAARGLLSFCAAHACDEVAAARLSKDIAAGLEKWASTGNKLYYAYWLMQLLVLGCRFPAMLPKENASRLLADLHTKSDTSGESCWEVAILCVEARCAMVVFEDKEAAESLYLQALRRAKETGAAWMILRAATEAMNLGLGNGTPARAQMWAENAWAAYRNEWAGTPLWRRFCALYKRGSDSGVGKEEGS